MCISVNHLKHAVLKDCCKRVVEIAAEDSSWLKVLQTSEESHGGVVRARADQERYGLFGPEMVVPKS